MVIFQFVLIFSVIATVGVIKNALGQTGTDSQSVITSTNFGLLGIGAGLAIGLAGIGGGLGIQTTGAAAISVLGENPKDFFKAFLIVALAEALAIYGLIIAILLWMKIPAV